LFSGAFNFNAKGKAARNLKEKKRGYSEGMVIRGWCTDRGARKERV